MSSLVKAAVLSAIVFVVLIVGALFLINSNKGPVRKGPDLVDAPAEKPTVVEEKALVNSAPIERPLSRDAVKVAVEIVEKGRKRKLQGSRVMVLKATDGDRTGDKVVEKTGDGSFELDLEPGAYVARVSCPKFTGQKRLFTVIKDTPQALTFELERGNQISGHVYAKGGAPIGGARVLALRELHMPGADLEEILIGMIGIQEMTGKAAFAAEAITADDGSYSLDGLEVFAFTVRATAANHVPGEVAEIPAPRAGVDLYLEKGGEVGGVVLDTNGAAVGGASIHAYPFMESQDVFRIIMIKARPPIDIAESGPNGQFQFKTLGPGIYNFLVEGPGYQTGEFPKQRVAPGSTSDLTFKIKPGLPLKGIVLDPNGQPVAGAKIRSTLSSGGGAAPRKETINITFNEDNIVTNDQGEFMADTLEEGTYMLLCWHPDYQTLRKTDVRVGPGSEELKLKLSHGGRIRGVVTESSTGKPIAGARLSANDMADLHKDAVTQEDGTFVLGGLGGSGSGKTVTVNVNAGGFARLRKDVPIQDNREVEENFELQPTGLVSGRVVNSEGAAISGARVMAKRANEASSSVEQTLANDITDRDGKFQLAGIEAGANTWVRVKRSEYLDGASESFELAASESVELPTIVLKLGGSIEGKVVGPDGNPLDGAMVTVTNEGETESEQSGNPQCPTTSRGEFIIHGLTSGSIDLVVKATHYLEKRVTGLIIEEGSKRGGVLVQMERGNAVAGVVTDAKGKAIAYAEVIAKDFSEGVKELRATTGNDGHFTVEGIISNATVELQVTHENYVAWSDPKVRVGASDVQVVLKEMGSLHGIVVTSDGKPVEVSFTVQAQNPAMKDPRKQPKSQNFTSPDGSFDYKGVPAGTYSVQVKAPPFAVASIADVRVGDGEAVDLGTIELQAGGRVFGKVVAADTRQPVEGVRVQIAQGSSRFMSTGTATGGSAPNPIQTTGADGTFAFNGLKSGNLSLRITHEGYLSRKLDDVNPDDSSKSQDLVIELEQGGEISGTVYDSNATARAGIDVYLIGEDASTNQTQRTDKAGLFHFQGVASGTFTLKAHKFGSAEGGQEQAEVSVEVSPGSSQSVDLQLE